MEHLLADFCGFSGQRMNRGKSKLWFSPNTPCYLRHAMSSKFQVPVTLELGKYLGIPLFYGRPMKRFQYLVEQVKKRLAGWKLKSLSKAVRLILVQSTLLAIPVYSMQTATIPISTIREIEALCRSFFWGAAPGQRRMAAVSWKQICRPKPVGGLGLPNLREVNLALLAKLLWKLIYCPKSFSSQLLYQKYGG